MYKFNSPTYGELSFSQVLDKITDYISREPDSTYRVVIGTDSQPKNSRRFDFVTAIVVQRVGSGGIYFWQRFIRQKKYYLRERIYEEALLSLDLARRFIAFFPENKVNLPSQSAAGLPVSKYGGEATGKLVALHGLEIHVDVGRAGETREMITEVVGMIRGQGFEVKTKPDAYGAASVADRHA